MSPILFTIGPFNVYAFGFFLSLAFLFSTFIVWKYAHEDLKEEEYLDAYLYTSLVALISGRAVYIILHFDEFGLNILKYIVVRETPGLSLEAGLLGSILFLFWYSKKKKEDFWKILDLFSLAGSFALVLAKIGEQLGGASFGRETNFFLGVQVAGSSGRQHPVEFYEAALLILVTYILYQVYKKVIRDKWPQGLVACIFGFSASLIIFLLEFLKARPVYLYGLSLKQIVSVVFLLIIIPSLIKRVKLLKRTIV